VGLTKSISRAGASAGTVSAHELAIPRKARDAFDKGIVLMRSQADFKGALAQFQVAIHNFPDYYEAYAVEGVAYISLKDASSAETALRKSIDLSSSRYPDAFFLLAGLLTSAGKFPEAETAARTATTLDPSSWAAHYELAHVLYLLRRSEEAEPETTRAHELNPDNPKIMLLLADIHLDRRNYSSVLQDLDVYLKLDPASPDADQVRKERDHVQQGMSKVPALPSLDHIDQ
jgi:tetratricopeptide (TPR) repeat protein